MSQLIVALDVNSLSEAYRLIDFLSPEIEYFKVGITPHTLFGEPLLQRLQLLNKKVFLDLKFHDIPNTVKLAMQAATQKGVAMLTLHCLGGLPMLQAAVAAINESQVRDKPLLLGVTMLTSMTSTDLSALGFSATTISAQVLNLAKLAKDAGLDGVIASAQEAQMIKENLGKDFSVVTPGVRPTWSLANAKEDQKRIVTPKQAALAGADYIVVGRPIIQAKDPLQAARKIIRELNESE